MAGKAASLLFVGTGSALAESGRFHSSVLVQMAGFSILVDAGDGVAFALIKAGVSVSGISAVVITHFHPDHFSGIASLLMQMKLQKRKAPLLVFCFQESTGFLEMYLRHAFILRERLPFQLHILGFADREEVSLPAAAGSFIPVGNTHLQKYAGEPAMTDIPLAAFSLLFRYTGHSLFYSSDLGSVNDLAAAGVPSGAVIVIDATHCGLLEAADWARSVGAGQVFFTHISGAGQQIPPGALAAEDGLNIGW